jgi:hypothetical protein
MGGGNRGRTEPSASDPDDQFRNAGRDGADGAGPGRRRRESAPLGRAVIGGLIGATCATLVILPAIFATLQSRRAAISASLDPNDPQSRYFEPVPRLVTVTDHDDGRAQHWDRALIKRTAEADFEVRTS